ncbi:MAG: acyltransferase [Bacteroidales bacterium]|nr:acyltransferase [Bacteroidales bacterium]
MIKELSKTDTSVIKGIGILCIITHNLFHWCGPLTGKENEFWFIWDNIFYFFRAFYEHPADSFNIFFSYLGHYGVQLFIFISGYGLAKSMIKSPQKYFSFLKTRCLKLYILLIIAFVFHFMFAITAYYHVLNWEEIRSFIYKFLFVHTFIPNEGLSLNGPLWFIGLIFQLYILFPLIFHLTQKYGIKAFIAIVIISYTIVYICQYVHILPDGLFVMQNFPGHLPEFALGVLFATSQKKCNNWILLIVSIIVFCLGNFYMAAYPLTFLSITYIFICLYMMLAKSNQNAAKRFLIYFGNISMIIFAIHSQVRWPFAELALKANNAWYTLMLYVFFMISIVILSLAAKIMYEWLTKAFSNLKISKPKNMIPIVCLIALFFTGCNNDSKTFIYPNSKVWAHRVNDTTVAMKKSKCFDGLEVDVYYSEYQNKIFVGHNAEDTTNNLQLCNWFDAIEKPAEKYFWIDFKNLEPQNADKAADIIYSIMENKGMKDNLLVESYDTKALKIVKKHGLRVILWTENPQWNNVDTATWIADTKKMIDELKPDAISNEAEMYELLTEYFPSQNIHLWNTPSEYSEPDIEFTRRLCQDKSVKVVLVDYDEPINY